MDFAHPLLLLNLLPIVAAGIWLMRRANSVATVPFVHLWPNDFTPGGSQWRLARLPIWITLLLLGAGLAVLAAAGLSWGTSWHRPVQLVVDRGVSLSARDAQGRPVFDAAVERLREDGSLGFHFSKIHHVPAINPGGSAPVASSLDTLQSLHSTIALARSASADPILVVTARAIETPPGVIVYHPEVPGGNAGIVSLAVEAMPSPAAMVVIGSTVSQRCRVSVSTNDQSVVQTADVVAGKPQVVHVDLPGVGEIVHARVAADDNSIAADDDAWVVAEGMRPVLHVSPAAPVALARLAEAFARTHPPAATAPVVRLTTRVDELESGASIVVDTSGKPLDAAGDGSVKLAGDFAPPVAWDVLLRGATVGPTPGSSWKPMVRRGEQVLVAERLAPSRAILVTFWSDAMENERDFVVLFAALIDRVSPGLVKYASSPIAAQPGWTLLQGGAADVEPAPGAYRDEAGMLRAMNVAYVGAQPVDNSDRAEAALRDLPRITGGGVRLDRPLALAAVMLVGAGAWIAARRGALAR